MSINYCTVDQVNIVSAVQADEPLYVSVYADDEPPYVAVIADPDAPSYLNVFSRDLTVAFDGSSNWWFGYALWLNINGSPYALTYAAPNQQITLTPYVQGSPTPRQIWGMRHVTPLGGVNCILIPTYDYTERVVMDLKNSGTSIGTPILSWHLDAGVAVNQYWHYQEVLP
ncbi:MAG TPA: hypothetical protein VGG20_28970 [Thermoanaerobaculia bacterium]|jgi:hypothetical protein